MFRFDFMKWLIVMMVLALPSIAYAASVKGVMKNKYVVLDEGEASGFFNRGRVCFFKNGSRVACGRVAKASANKSFVRVSRRKIKRIKKGMSARIIETSFSSSSAIAEQNKVSPGQAIGATNVKLGYIMSPVMPSSFNLLSYGKGQSLGLASTGQVNNWNIEETNSTSFLGGGGELSFGLSTFKLTAGGRARFSPEKAFDSPYNSSGSIAQTLTLFRSFGGHSDFYYLVFRFGSHSLDLGNGLDFEYSQVRVLMSEISQSGDQELLHEISSNVGVLSIRTNARFNLYFDPIGLQVGSTLLVPVYATNSFEAATLDSQVDDSTYAADADYSLSHGKSQIGIDLFAGMFLGF